MRVRASVVAHLRLGAIFSSASRSSLSRLWKKLFRGDTIVPEDGPLLPDIVRRSGARPIVIEQSVPWRGPENELAILNISLDSLAPSEGTTRRADHGRHADG